MIKQYKLKKIFPFLFNDFIRTTWVVDQLGKMKKGESILDAGAGEQRYKPAASHLKYTSQDFCQYTPKQDVKGLHTQKWDTSKIDIVSDITSIPVKPRSFDNVMCVEVLEHVPEPEKAMAELSRILKPGGKLVLTVPFCSLTHMAPYHFVSGFNIYWLKETLKKNGFEIKSVIRFGNYFDYVLQEMLRTPIMISKYSTIGILSYLLYLFILPTALVTFLLSLLTKLSEETLCLGYGVLAIKKDRYESL